MTHRSRIQAGLIAILITVTASACAPTPTAPAPAGAALSIIIPDRDWDSLQLGYVGEPAYAKLRAITSGPRAATISEGDIEVYDWKRQSLTLTSASSARLLADLRNPAAPGADFAFDHRVFIVMLGTDFVYGGVFLHPMSPMGIDYPVMAADSARGRIVLTIRPRQSIFLGEPDRIADWGPIKNEAVRARFKALGKLTE